MIFPNCIEIDLLEDNETETELESFQVFLMASEGFEDLVDIETDVLEVIVVDNDRGEYNCVQQMEHWHTSGPVRRWDSHQCCPRPYSSYR